MAYQGTNQEMQTLQRRRAIPELRVALSGLLRVPVSATMRQTDGNARF